MRKREVIHAAVLFIAIGCACSMASYLLVSFLGSEYAAGKFAMWHSLGAPPGKAVRIVRLVPTRERTVEVEVETPTGQFFRYTKDRKMWIEVDIPESERYRGVGSCDRIPDAAFTSYLGGLPAKPIDCATQIWSWEWVSDAEHFVVLGDGSVWWWHEHTGIDTWLAATVGSCCGGALIGAGLAFLAIRRLQAARPQA